MFGGGTSTEYDDIVVKTTDENLTSENWELILNLCDKVDDEGQAGAHSAVAAIIKRMAHRSPNVQLYALSLAEALGKNVGINVHREISSRAFTQALEKLIIDRNTHEKVRKRALGLISMWAGEFENDETLGIMEDCYNNLKAKNYKFNEVKEPPPPTVDDEIRRKEEEELQRVLEMSMQDRGGRSQWAEYSLSSGSGSGSGSGTGKAPATSSSAAGGSSSSGAGSSATASASTASNAFAKPKYQAGYVPARTPSPVAQPQSPVLAHSQPHPAHHQSHHAQPAHQHHQHHDNYQAQVQQHSSPTQHSSHSHYHSSSVSSIPSSTPTPQPVQQSTSPTAALAAGNIVTRVRALHTFQPTESGELAFEKGDIIKVVDRGYKDWWRGQLKGRTGIFPVNYVEAMPEPTAAELAKEAEQEAAVFAQAVNVEKLLNMLRALDPAKDNLADNEEIQELYRSSMALRPKIVKLIDKYSQKRADLVSMNETFVRARTIFDRMMEESLARHTGVYDQGAYRPPVQYGPQARPDAGGAGRRPEYGPAPGPQPQGYPGWNPALYDQQQQRQQAPPPQQQPAYAGYPSQAQPGYPGVIPQAQPTPAQQELGVTSPYGPAATPAPGMIPGAAGVYGPQPGQVQPTPQPQIAAGYGVVAQGGYAANAPYSQQGPTPYPAQAQAQQQPVQQPAQQIQQQPLQPQPAQQPIQQPIQQQPLQPQPAQQPIQQQPLQPQQVQQPIQQQPLQPQPAQQPVQQQPQAQQQPPLQQQPSFISQPAQQQPHAQSQTNLQQQPSFMGQPAQAQPQTDLQQQPSFMGQPAQQQPQAQPQVNLQQQPSFMGQPTQEQPAVAQQPEPTASISPQVQPQAQPQAQPQQAYQQPGPQAQPQQQQPQQQPQPQPQQHVEPQPQPQPQEQPAQAQPAAASAAEAEMLNQVQAHQTIPAQPITGPPPYVFNPSYTYADPNVQAWAQYYAQGGKDLAGSVYFISIPGVTDGAGAASPTAAVAGQGEQTQAHGDAAHAAHHQQQQQQQQQNRQSWGSQQGHHAQQASSFGDGASPAGEHPYGASTTSLQGQLHANKRPSYQLSDPGFASAQPQNASNGAGASAQYASYPAGGGELGVRATSPIGGAGSPVAQGQLGASAPGPYGTSPQPGAAVPSWVLPKKGAPGGITGGMGGLNLGDPAA